jgi:acetyltransferase-like isoleucine patch superfamily enzyme
MSSLFGPLPGELRLYIANNVVSLIPLHWLRLWYYRCIMKFDIGSGSSIFMGCRFDCAEGLKMGKMSTINGECFLDARGKISIGDCVSITSGVWIITSKHDFESQEFIATSGAVVISDYVFIGRRAIILQDCTIGRGAVLGAGSVLTKSIPDFEVWAGNPAKKIGERKLRSFSYDCQYLRLLH